ncbi:glycoside hydrolase family 2 TIM barrel-domain containing protein [Curtobacterium sp. Leaf183]|uniref:glycoside hydrolase family 2 TIM barrel-domain containing protein n=1 Tax=Curtobacterium sp. Leaf183 TaxID=1736291 RepID=UPI0009E8A1C2|nr:glycoside hydrolase family 2 TIM barrel-domain containing protein [Curtobacterium sp. Leaf183]
MSAPHAVRPLGTTTPGSDSRLPPRARVRSDARALSLDGVWRFRLTDHAPLDEVDGIPPFAVHGSDGADWHDLVVPSHWPLHGHGSPWYTNIRYPFPVDPPHVPDTNPTGDHVRTVDLPDDWPATGRTVLRLDGAESLAHVWVNGTEIGWSTGSRLAVEYDVTDVLRPGTNTVALRVHQWSQGSYLEDQDQWWLPGVFRSVALEHRPVDALDDVFVTADRDPVTGRGRLRIETVTTAGSVTVRLPETGLEARISPASPAHLDVGVVDAWSAEIPRLYDLTVATDGERVRMRVGFRRVEVVGDQLLANGVPLVFHGVNRHETHPDLGRVFDEDVVRADLALMKRHNVQAVRTAHQPPHPRFLELADELGFWVVLECDLETHGFWEVDWVGNPSDDPTWRDAYLDRVRRTVERDKNHASVVMWSLGNESGTGRNLAAMADWIRQRDPSRPIHYEGDVDGAYTDVYSRMYPTLEEIDSVCGTVTMPVHETSGPAAGARQRAKPFLLCEYGHAMGNGPGMLAEYQERIERWPSLHGGFVWEWRDHGLRTRTADGTTYFGYGGDFGEPVHDGVFVMDGLVLSDGTPTPALADLAALWAPVRFVRTGSSLTVRNLRAHADTADLVVSWELRVDGRAVDDGTLDVPPVRPGSEATVALPSEAIAPRRGHRAHLTFRADLRADTAWADAGHAVASGQVAADVVAVEPVEAESGRPGRTALPVSAVFSDDGTLRSWRGVPLAGPRPELWRAPTENDRAAGQGSSETVLPELTSGRGDESVPPSADRWRERGLDRLTHRVLSLETDGRALVQRVRSMPAGSSTGIESEFRWTGDDGSLRLRWTTVPIGPWDCTWPRIGLHLELPEDLTDDASWWGTGPHESYADARNGVEVGRFTAPIDDLGIRYARPQETGHRPGLHELRLGPLVVAAAEGHGATLPGFQVARHSAQQWSAVGHAHELPASDRLHLYLDAAQHGLGSRACGPDVLPRYALWPRQVALDITFR